MEGDEKALILDSRVDNVFDRDYFVYYKAPGRSWFGELISFSDINKVIALTPSFYSDIMSKRRVKYIALKIRDNQGGHNDYFIRKKDIHL